MGTGLVSRFGQAGRVKPLNGIAVLAMSLTLAGCSAGAIADLPSPVGLPQGTPARPAEVGEYPNVYDRPAKQADTLLDDREQTRLQKDLARVRARQTGKPEPKDDEAAKSNKPGKPVNLGNSGQ